MAEKKFIIKLDKRYNSKEREAIASEVIDFIKNRTIDLSKDKDNIKFGKYTKEYIKLKGQTNVDLTFSGEMLSELKLLRERVGAITIGIEGDSRLIGKVEGNIEGTYGQSKPVTKPRDFLGISFGKFEQIRRKFPLNSKAKREERAKIVSASKEFAENIELE